MAPRRRGSNPTAGPEPVAIKLANTVGWRFDEAHRTERLPDAESLLLWSLAVGVLAPAEADAVAAAGEAALAAEARRVRELREAAYAALLAHTGGRPPPAAALGTVHAHVADAVRQARPAAGLPLRWEVGVPGGDPGRVTGRRLALAVGDLLGGAGLALVGRCANDPCGWLFLDRTRSHTRRWCSSAGCGNRERAQRHYERHRSAGFGPATGPAPGTG
jgi:predicted RNA-binding Zn ribbon-like protein